MGWRQRSRGQGSGKFRSAWLSDVSQRPTSLSFSCGECHRRKQKVCRHTFSSLIFIQFTVASATVKYLVPMYVCPYLSSGRTLIEGIQCIARKVPELCKAYTPGKADQDLNARILRLEHIVEMALPQFCSPSGTPLAYPIDQSSMHARQRTPSNGEDDTRSQTEEQDPSNGIFQSGKWYGTSASGSVAPASVIEQVCVRTRHFEVWCLISW